MALEILDLINVRPSSTLEGGSDFVGESLTATLAATIQTSFINSSTSSRGQAPLTHLTRENSDQKVAIMPEAPFIVTIDGPAASGKSSVSRELARRLGWSWVSTGAFYRGLAYVAFAHSVDFTDESALVRIAQTADWQVRLTSDETLVYLNGTDVTREVSLEENGTRASKISSFPAVRLALLDAQRQCAKGVLGLIAEGRDCGTVVFPGAQVKIFLTARAEDRAARRARDEGQDLDKMIQEQRQRDSQDANRKAAPMLAPEGSNTIDTTKLSLPEVVDQVEDLIREKVARSSN